jgi:hypothetical protein
MSAVWTNETRMAALAVCTSNHWAPTVCIHDPTLLTREAIQSQRNTLTLSGAQIDEVALDRFTSRRPTNVGHFPF